MTHTYIGIIVCMSETHQKRNETSHSFHLIRLQRMCQAMEKQDNKALCLCVYIRNLFGCLDGVRFDMLDREVIAAPGSHVESVKIM